MILKETIIEKQHLHTYVTRDSGTDVFLSFYEILEKSFFKTHTGNYGQQLLTFPSNIDRLSI